VIHPAGYWLQDRGHLPRAALRPGETVKPGQLLVFRQRRDPEGYYEVALGKIHGLLTWPSLEQHSMRRPPSWARLTAAIKGGLSVGCGRARFLPLSRSGVRDAPRWKSSSAGDSLACITKLDVN